MTYEEEIYRWGIPIISGSSKSLAHKTSNHFYIITDADMSEHETFYFSSPHLHRISTENPEVAFYRAKALLRLLNGIRTLRDHSPVGLIRSNIFHFNNSADRKVFTIRDNSQLEYEELQNPFLDKEVLNEVNSERSLKFSNDSYYEVDLFELAYKDELVKEVLVLFSLVKTEPLYLLINTLKIIESIEFDLGLQIEKKKNGKKKKTSEIKMEREIIFDRVTEVLKSKSTFFMNAYNFFRKTGKGSFTHFINTRDGSGIFARHGAKNEDYLDEAGNPAPIISFKEIEYNIQVLIYEWINYKLLKAKGVRYPPVEKKTKINKDSLFF